MAVNNEWPWTPETSAQGFLSGRWLRRGGDAFGGIPAEVLSSYFILPMPTEVGAVVGSCGFVGSVSSWRIAADNDEGFWAINNRGLITVAALGMYEDVIYEIGVTAQNAYGVSAITPIYIRPTTGGVASREIRSGNSPVPGGESANAPVSVSSGEPRSGPSVNPPRNIRPSVKR